MTSPAEATEAARRVPVWTVRGLGAGPALPAATLIVSPEGQGILARPGVTAPTSPGN